MNPQFWWYVVRASGMVAAVLIALMLIWGLLLTTKVIPRKGMPAWLTDLHRGLGGLACIFLGVHLFALFADSYEHFAWKELFVPFAVGLEVRPRRLGIGAFWMLVIVEGTSLVQRRLPRKTWRGLHYLSYPIAVLVGLHAMTAGTDSSNRVFRIVTFGLLGLLSILTAYRYLTRGQKRSGSGGRVPATSKDRVAAR